MNRKFLESELSVIEDETTKKSIIDNIMKKNGEQIEAHKVEVETLKNDVKTKQGVIDNLNNELQEAKKVDIEQVKKEQFDLGKAEGTKEIEIFKKSNALSEELKKTKAKDITLLSKLLDNEKISYEVKDGKYEIGGLTEQIEEIKKSHDYLFESEEPKEQRMNIGDNNKNENNSSSSGSPKINPMFKTYN